MASNIQIVQDIPTYVLDGLPQFTFNVNAADLMVGPEQDITIRVIPEGGADPYPISLTSGAQPNYGASIILDANTWSGSNIIVKIGALSLSFI